MPPKTERIELRVEADLLERVDEWRQRQDDLPSRSEAFRRLSEIGLEGHTQEGFRLGDRDKLVVWLLTEILRNQAAGKVNANDAKNAQRTVGLIQEAIYGGHFWALPWEMQGVFHDHADDPKKVRRVVNILDTWSFVESAFQRLSDDEKKLVEKETGWKDPKFIGFDGNNESEYYGIAQFLVEELGRFQSFKGRSFNSHSPTVARYSAMAAAFEPIRANLIGRELSAEEIIHLLKQR